jgi:hypothetical protein
LQHVRTNIFELYEFQIFTLFINGLNGYFLITSGAGIGSLRQRPERITVCHASGVE